MHRIAVLRITFADVDRNWPKRFPRITAVQARRIVRFVNRHNDLPVLFIHCGAGISHSRGVALALADAYGWKYKTPIYNAYVHRKVLDQAMKLKRAG